MPQTKTEKFLRPLMVKIPGQEEQLARLSFPHSGRELPEAGAWCPWVGKKGNFWRRRVAEGSAVEGKPPVVSAVESRGTEL